MVKQGSTVDQMEMKLNDRLALDRSQLAADRTLMAWVRTALSLITFGFTVYKFLQVFVEQSKSPVPHPQAPVVIGVTLISLGTTSLVVACMQYWQYINKLNKYISDEPYKRWDFTFIVACSLGLLGLLMLGNIILRFGPFS